MEEGARRDVAGPADPVAREFLRLETVDAVARVTLARPKHNVLNIAMLEEFAALLASLAADDALKAVAIFGDGPNWCAGVDVGEHAPEVAPQMIGAFNAVLEGIARLEVPTVAAVQGRVLGGGLEVALACDIIVAAEGALLGVPEVKLGFFPPYAAVRLPRLVGLARAIEICTTGATYTAAEAAALGFVSRVVPADAFPAAVERLLSEFTGSSPLILRMNKRAVLQYSGLEPGRALAQASECFLGPLLRTEDTREGIASFFEKRKPSWKNR